MSTYVVLGLGLPSGAVVDGQWSPGHDGGLRQLRWQLPSDSSLSVALLDEPAELSLRGWAGRLLYSGPDEIARTVSDALASRIAWGTRSYQLDLAPVKVPEDLFGDQPVPGVELERHLPGPALVLGDEHVPAMAANDFIGLPVPQVVDALNDLAIVLLNDTQSRVKLKPALSYYRQSLFSFDFTLNDEMDAIQQPDLKPSKDGERARAQDSFLNAFKSIESLLDGDPSRRDNRVLARLEEIGVDPDKPISLEWADAVVDGGTFFTKLRDIQAKRDKRAAHGRSAALKELTYLELLEARKLAHAFCGAALRALEPAAREQFPKQRVTYTDAKTGDTWCYPDD